MVSREEFWSSCMNLPFIRKIVEKLKPGECSKPISMQKLISELKLSAPLKTPYLISLDSLEILPKALRKRNLYVIRLGQRHDKKAKFIICRASENYKNELIRKRDLEKFKKYEKLKVKTPKWLKVLSSKMGEETLATYAISHFVNTSGERKSCELTSLRFGSVKFNFVPTSLSSTYTYWGQVEIDHAIFSEKIFAIEIKSERVETLFKFKVVFSALVLSKLTGEAVYPMVAFIPKFSSGMKVYLALLSQVRYENLLPIDTIGVEKTILITLK